jgi:hypothetical protein
VKPKHAAGIVIASLLALSSAASAQTVASMATRLDRVQTYTEFDNGVVLFRPTQAQTGCEGGYFIRRTDVGFDTTFTALMAALRDRTAVIVYAELAVLWPHSSAKYCHAAVVVALSSDWRSF